ncbi:hypothetical protein ElyMa_000813800 [Elysia marginata]|uniref:Uncharacterized protein n=1 Tax=Elysia marginata TaxID=1093978 RepID=A0AAV4GX77_9GAST|nr:hypothetical protein ElyMa_000813800 [Elysia marginata]
MHSGAETDRYLYAFDTPFYPEARRQAQTIWSANGLPRGTRGGRRKRRRIQVLLTDSRYKQAGSTLTGINNNHCATGANKHILVKISLENRQNKSDQHFTVGYLNSRSVFNKTEELKDLIT